MSVLDVVPPVWEELSEAHSVFGVGVVLFSVAVCHWNQRLICKHSVTVLDRCVSPQTHTHTRGTKLATHHTPAGACGSQACRHGRPSGSCSSSSGWRWRRTCMAGSVTGVYWRTGCRGFLSGCNAESEKAAAGHRADGPTSPGCCRHLTSLCPWHGTKTIITFL